LNFINWVLIVNMLPIERKIITTITSLIKNNHITKK